MAARTHARLKSGGGKGGSDSFWANLFTLGGQNTNQPVSQDIQPPEYSGPPQYYGQGGEVVNQPFSDQSWMSKLVGKPDLNQQYAYGQAQAAGLNQQDIAKQKTLDALELNQLKSKGAIQYGQGDIPIGSQFAVPGDVPFGASVMPEDVISEAQTNKQPYLNYGKGVEANLKASDEASMQAYRKAEIEHFNKPQVLSSGDTVYTFDPASGKVIPQWSSYAGRETKPTIDKNGNVSFGGYMPPQLINRQPRQVDNYKTGPSIEPSELGPVTSPGGYYSNSGQDQEWMNVDPNTGQPFKTTSQGGAPQVESSVLETPRKVSFPRVMPGRSSGGVLKGNVGEQQIEGPSLEEQRLLEIIRRTRAGGY